MSFDDGEESKNIEITIDPPKPHSRKQELIMTAMQMPVLEKLYVACGSKFGKSLAISTCLAQAAVQRKRTKWRWIAPIYEQSKVGMDYFRKILPPDPHTDFKDNAMRILMPFIETEIQFWHCKNPMSLEGAGIHGNIFDEAAKCPYAAVAASLTTTTFTRGFNGYVSTPMGKNWFYKECMEAREHMRWSLKKGLPPKRVFITAPTTANPFIQLAAIEEARRTLPDRLFRQYYLAEFLDDGSVFIGFRDCIEGQRIDVYGGIQLWTHSQAREYQVFLGVDWAKKEDYTVITAFSVIEGKPRLVGFMRFQGIGYVDALKELYKFSKMFKNVINIKHDRTGVGEALDDMLAQLDLPFEGVVFTSTSKAAMVSQLTLAFQTKELALVDWPEMISELESYTVVVNDLGNARYSAPQGLHDDIVSSLMLGFCAAKEYSSEFRLQFLEELPQSKMTVAKWYMDLAQNED